MVAGQQAIRSSTEFIPFVCFLGQSKRNRFRSTKRTLYLLRIRTFKLSSPGCQMLDPLYVFWLQTKIEDIEVGPHMVGIGGARQWNHADFKSEPEDNLRDRSMMTGRDPG